MTQDPRDMAFSTLMMDVDGVLAGGRPDDGRRLDAEMKADLGLDPELLQVHFFRPHWVEIVTGREPIEPRLSEVLARVAPHVTAGQVLDYWLANDARIHADVLAELGTYRRAGIKVFLATNQEHRRAAYLMDQMGFSAHVDGMIHSAGLGWRKPGHEFYRLATERAGVAAGDIMFVDDTFENVAAARRFGWQAVHWTPGATLGSLIGPPPARRDTKDEGRVET